MPAKYGHTMAEVSLSAFRSNLITLQERLSKNSKLLAVIKTNAYGHGIVPIAKEAVKAGAERLGVTKVEEGVLLRKNGIHVPIHLLSPISKEQVLDVIQYNLISSISNNEVIKEISRIAVKQNQVATVHLKLDTGLHRFGIRTEDAIRFCQENYFLPNLYWEGIYTHFSNADEGDWRTTDYQFYLFIHTVKRLEKNGFIFALKHVGASTITMECKDMHLDLVRPGIALFGYHPNTRQEGLVTLKPVMSLKSRIIEIHELPVNTEVGYGGKYVTKQEEKIAIIPIGHGDGYKRALSDNGYVLVNGRFAKIVGTIALDQTFINITHIPDVKVGDEVVLIGSDGKLKITARDIANWMDSNVDEVLASLMDRVKRIYI